MAQRYELRCKIYPLGTLQKLKYVVVCSFYRGKYLLSRHWERDTWETQGGHIEPGETALEAARRELFEESGAITLTWQAEAGKPSLRCCLPSGVCCFDLAA